MQPRADVSTARHLLSPGTPGSRDLTSVDDPSSHLALAPRLIAPPLIASRLSIPSSLVTLQDRALWVVQNSPEFLSLKIAAHRKPLIRKIRQNSTTSLESGTGTGKSTGLPILIAAAGCDTVLCVPRRAQCITIANRIAHLLGEDGPGHSVGYYTRFEKKWSKDTSIHVMTDGYLEVHSLVGKSLKRPDRPLVLILDEIHVGTMHQALVQGLWKQILDNPRQAPGYRLVLSTATLNQNETLNFFPNAKLFKLPGTPFPITELPVSGDPREMVTRAVCDRGWNVGVRCPGKREIEMLQEELEISLGDDAEILPFHADLTTEQLMRVYEMEGKRYVVLTTDNDGLTFPGLDYMIDLGLRRTQRSDGTFSSLITEAATQADYLQSKGRVGREKPGYFTCCLGTPFADRKPFPDTELKRISPDEAVLRVASLSGLKLRKIPVPGAPSALVYEEATHRLQEQGFLDDDEAATERGRAVGDLPIMPNMGQMLLAAEREGVLPHAVALCAMMQAHGICMRSTTVWQELCGDDCTSDLIAGLRLFQHGLKICLNHKPEDQFKLLDEAGIKVRRFGRARESFLDIMDRLQNRTRSGYPGEISRHYFQGLADIPAFEELEIKNNLAPKLARALLAGFPHGAFFRDRDGYQGLPPDRRRYLNALSVVPDHSNSRYVVGVPWTFDPNGDGNSREARHVILWATPIARDSVPDELLALESSMHDKSTRKVRETKRRGHPGTRGGNSGRRF